MNPDDDVEVHDDVVIIEQVADKYAGPNREVTRTRSVIPYDSILLVEVQLFYNRGEYAEGLARAAGVI